MATISLGGAPPPPPPSFSSPPPPPAPAPQSSSSSSTLVTSTSTSSVPKDVISPRAGELQKEQKEQQKEHQKEHPHHAEHVGEEHAAVVDYTKIPTQLEQRFEEFDESNSLRPTIINPGNSWTKSFHKSLLSEAEKKTMDTEEQGTEKNKAFDLLDALTKSGALSVDFADLHVVIASTHCFDKSIIGVIVKDNVNPIEKVENSALIIATTIHQAPAQALVAPEQLDRISNTSAKLFGDKDLIEM